MKLALFGGTFDPVHLGHLAIARAAAAKFDLNLIYFVPADVPPHKGNRSLTEFQHRFAMLALATADEERFVPSLLEANSGQPNYSIQTVRRLKRTLKKSDKLYFLTSYFHTNSFRLAPKGGYWRNRTPHWLNGQDFVLFYLHAAFLGRPSSFWASAPF